MGSYRHRIDIGRAVDHILDLRCGGRASDLLMRRRKEGKMEKLKDLIRKVARAIKRAFWFILAEDPCQEPRRGKHDPKPEPKKPKGKRPRDHPHQGEDIFQDLFLPSIYFHFYSSIGRKTKPSPSILRIAFVFLSYTISK